MRGECTIRLRQRERHGSHLSGSPGLLDGIAAAPSAFETGGMIHVQPLDRASSGCGFPGRRGRRLHEQPAGLRCNRSVLAVLRGAPEALSGVRLSRPERRVRRPCARRYPSVSTRARSMRAARGRQPTGEGADRHEDRDRSRSWPGRAARARTAAHRRASTPTTSPSHDGNPIRDEPRHARQHQPHQARRRSVASIKRADRASRRHCS